ncbi:hypothetical protein [Streptomyces sp. NPDC001401]
MTVVQQLNLIRLPADPMPVRRFHPNSVATASVTPITATSAYATRR